MSIKYSFYYFGPLLVRFKVSPEILVAVKKIISKKTLKMTKDLAGVIEHEYEVSPETYDQIMRPYIDGYAEAYKNWTGGETIKGLLKTTRAWVNYMKPHDYNPPHIHTDCRISSVVFLSVPDKLKKENKKWRDRQIKSNGPGSIAFNAMLGGEFCNGGIEMFPEEGDFFMFPANLLHYVAPFRSKCERISLAANFGLVENRY